MIYGQCWRDRVVNIIKITDILYTYIYILFLSDKVPMLETLNYTIRIGSIHRPFYISICISTLPTQHTIFIYNYIYIYIYYTVPLIIKTLFVTFFKLSPQCFLSLNMFS